MLNVCILWLYVKCMYIMAICKMYVYYGYMLNVCILWLYVKCMYICCIENNSDKIIFTRALRTIFLKLRIDFPHFLKNFESIIFNPKKDYSIFLTEFVIKS